MGLIQPHTTRSVNSTATTISATGPGTFIFPAQVGWLLDAVSAHYHTTTTVDGAFGLLSITDYLNQAHGFLFDIVPATIPAARNGVTVNLTNLNIRLLNSPAAVILFSAVQVDMVTTSTDALGLRNRLACTYRAV